MKKNFLITGDYPEKLGYYLNYMGESARQTIGGVKLTSRIAEQADFQTLNEHREICSRWDIPFYIGGGIADDAMLNGDVYELTKRLHAAGIDAIEISNPRGFPTAEFLNIARSLRRDFQTLLVEVGEKNCISYPFNWWAQRVLNAEEVQADHIVLEGATSGEVGIYDRFGNPNTGLVRSISSLVVDRASLVIEASRPEHQEIWLDMFGQNVKLGNVIANPDYIEDLEYLRRQRPVIIDVN